MTTLTTTLPPLAPRFVMASLALGNAQAAPVPPPALAEAQLRAINHRFVDALLAPNPAFMAALTADDFLLTAGDGSWRSRAEFLAPFAGPTALQGAAYDGVQVRLFGPVALLHAVFQGLPGDGPPIEVRYTDVYRWNGSAWRLISGQNTPIKPGTGWQLHSAPMPVGAPWAGQDPTGDDLAVLRTLNEQYVQAFREADVAWYDAHLSSDYLVINGDGSIGDKAAALANFAKPTFATSMASFPVGKVNIRRFDDVALIHAENDYALKDGRTGISRYTDIWHKRDGRWVCVAAHITVHRAPQ